ncbi:hypothetical protein VSAL_I1235 [Aliivibrio salmonicida LFI1238]|jgi:hypothetical protein|uniref:Uncharacterized protein n=1 Tax=Aliivibrio salmonicida (strain LFI1238) TaxID=316275 RepID=B6EJX3_ALISL|nr:hypothetical protein VSAL_I1235 [Aliivibrio salmonicida LFI1238]
MKNETMIEGMEHLFTTMKVPFNGVEEPDSR